jgi:hypothetical protein
LSHRPTEVRREEGYSKEAEAEEVEQLWRRRGPYRRIVEVRQLHLHHHSEV